MELLTKQLLAICMYGGFVLVPSFTFLIGVAYFRETSRGNYDSLIFHLAMALTEPLRSKGRWKRLWYWFYPILIFNLNVWLGLMFLIYRLFCFQFRRKVMKAKAQLPDSFYQTA